MLAALGTLVYTHVIYKRPPITEEGEAKALGKLYGGKRTPAVSGLISFDPVTINIAPSPGQSGGRLHFATIGFSVEIQDTAYSSWVERVRPLIQDRLVSVVGRFQFQDLNSVQGRYILRSKLIEDINQIISRDASRIAPASPSADGAGDESGESAGATGGVGSPPAGGPVGAEDVPDNLITNVYFSQFIVQ